MSPRQREERTFRLERWRALATGIIEPLGGTFFLLIAIRFHQAGETAQALVATGGSAGLLLGPPVVALTERLGWRINRALAAFQWIMATAILLAGITQWLTLYVAAGLLALTAGAACIPLSTQFYQQNYPAQRRGTLFSIASTIRLATAAATTWLAGHWLEQDLHHSHHILVTMAAAAAFSGWLFWLCPGDPLQPGHSRHPFRALNLLLQDRKFLHLIVIWMLMGSGNLVMVPLRLKFLVEPQFGFSYSESQAAFIVGVLPSIMIFCFSWWWGKLFDRINFFLLRAILNTTFFISNIFFFLIGEYWGFIVGAIFLGISLSGGNVAWSLWVTKIAPPDRVADYMAVHTFMTGIRGMIAPALSVYLAATLPMPAVVAISCALLLISIILLGPEITTWRRRRPSQPLAEGLAE